MIRVWSMILAVAASLIGAAALAQPVKVLRISNEDRGTIMVLPLPDNRLMSITYHHSMYDQPVTEEFAVTDAGMMRLRTVRSPSAAVLEYFGITRPGQQPKYSLSVITTRVAMGKPQQITVGAEQISLLKLGNHGDRLTIRTAEVSRATQLMQRIRQITLPA